MEGVHCDKHDCIIENVWWDDVCEDALSVKGGSASSVTKVIGGGARYADDKVIQHNGYGKVEIDGFYGEDISKLYRSCGTCGDKARKVSVSNVYVVNPGNAVVTVNKNWNDEATLSNIWIKSSKSTVKVCQWSQGNANGEPTILGNGPSAPLCQYSESDVHINEDISNAAQTSPSSTSSSSGVTQTASSSSTDSSVASSASSSQVPTQASSSSTASSLSSSASASASASSQISSNSSSTDDSDAAGPGTVSPVESGSFEQSVVSTDASRTEQQESTEEPTSAPSLSTSSSGSVDPSSEDVSQTAVQQSSVASSSATDVPMTDVVLDCGSSSGSNTKRGDVPSQPSSVASSSETDTPQTDVVFDCGSSNGSNTKRGDVPSQPSSVASSSETDTPQTDVMLDCGSSSGSSTVQIEVPTQESTAASTASGSDNAAQNEEQTIASSASGSTTSTSSFASSSSSSTGSTTQSSSTGSTTQSSGSDSPTQSSGSDSPTQSSGSDVPTQTATNSSGSVPDGTWPASTGTVLYKEPYTIKAGEVFDGKMQTFERSDITCTGGEGQKDTAVFLVEAGGTLKNAIIGKNQKEGVHCDDHDCTIENVWWDDVCEDALSIKGGSASSVTTVTNCGARYAEDKVVQHNGYGTVKIKGFFAQEFGKLYRSCGTCGNIPRIVTVENVYAIDPLVSVVTVNKNYNDKATLKNIYVKTTDGKDDVKVCQWSQGSKTPSNLGDGPSGSLCKYTESDIHINEE
ncbi:putative pectate lyase G [Phytophthora ramorum]|nr:putative pectate lyase G [Phytophthora ramorum]